MRWLILGAVLWAGWAMLRAAAGAPAKRGKRHRHRTAHAPVKTVHHPLPSTARQPSARKRAAPENLVVRQVPAAPLLLRYKDTGGEITERIVHPQALHRTLNAEGKLIRPRLMAHCTLRNDTRSFALSRIQSAARADTGELLDVPGYLGVDRA